MQTRLAWLACSPTMARCPVAMCGLRSCQGGSRGASCACSSGGTRTTYQAASLMVAGGL
jgi:hypothetical protein